MVDDVDLAGVIARIAAANCADPESDDLTVPLAVELADAQARITSLVEERDECKMQFAHAMQEFQIRNNELAAAEAETVRLRDKVESVLRGVQSVLLDAALKDRPIDTDVLQEVDKDLRAALAKPEGV